MRITNKQKDEWVRMRKTKQKRQTLAAVAYVTAAILLFCWLYSR